MLAELRANPEMLAIGLIAVFGVLWAIYLVIERDPEEAARRTSERGIGVATGAFGVGLAAAVEGIQMIAEMPGLVMGLVGLGGVLSGISWEVFSAVAVIVYIVVAAVRGD